MADRLRQLDYRYDWCEYFQLKIEFSECRGFRSDAKEYLIFLYRIKIST